MYKYSAIQVTMAKSDTVYPEILAIFKFGGLVLSGRNKDIGGFKFGGIIQYHHTYICMYV